MKFDILLLIVVWLFDS